MRYDFPLMSLPNTLDRVSRVLNDCAQHDINPAVVIESDDRVEIRIDVPGVDMDDIEMTLEKSALIIRGQRTFDVPENANVTGVRPATEFERRFQLHETLDLESVDAVLDRGVLTVQFSRRAELQPKKVTIRSAK